MVLPTFLLSLQSIRIWENTAKWPKASTGFITFIWKSNQPSSSPVVEASTRARGDANSTSNRQKCLVCRINKCSIYFLRFFTLSGICLCHSMATVARSFVWRHFFWHFNFSHFFFPNRSRLFVIIIHLHGLLSREEVNNPSPILILVYIF